MKYLIPIVLSSQNKLDEVNKSKTALMDQTCKLNDEFYQLQSDVSITKNVNHLLSCRLVDKKRKCWANS